MPAALSEDLRERVIGFIESGGSQAEAVERFDVSRTSIVRWLQRKRKTGKADALTPGRKGGTSRVKADALRDYIKEHPDQTLQEVGQHFGVSGVLIWKRLRQLNYTFKKRLFSTKSVAKKNAQRSRL
jgi:transposase